MAPKFAHAKLFDPIRTIRTRCEGRYHGADVTAYIICYSPSQFPGLGRFFFVSVYAVLFCKDRPYLTVGGCCAVDVLIIWRKAGPGESEPSSHSDLHIMAEDRPKCVVLTYWHQRSGASSELPLQILEKRCLMHACVHCSIHSCPGPAGMKIMGGLCMCMQPGGIGARPIAEMVSASTCAEIQEITHSHLIISTNAYPGIPAGGMPCCYGMS